MSIKKYLPYSILTSTIFLHGCDCEKPEPEPPPYTQDRGAIAIENDWYGDSAKNIVYLNQNWTPKDSLWFYYTGQGSELLPYTYFINLEQADNEELFITPHHMSRFRYLPQKKTTENPDALPVGFVRDENYLGLTCAACHTVQINYQGTGIRVDGAATLADMVSFLKALETSLRTTLENEDKFARFAQRVFAPKNRFLSDNPENRQALQEHLRETLTDIATYNTRNHSKTEYGFARVDAVGRIFNQAIKFTSGDDYFNEPNAPASYPFLWDAPQHDWVQWVGLTSNANAGSLGRNAGEVVGVFGKVTVVKHKTQVAKLLLGYDSTVKSTNLVEMEEWLRKLQSPQWPSDILPRIDNAKVYEGEKLYQEKCIKCHKLIDRSNPKRQIRAQMYDIDIVNTDPTEAMNTVTKVAPTGILEGAVMPGGGTYGKHIPVAVLLIDIVEGILVRHKEATLKAIENAVIHGNGLEDKPKEGEYTPDTKEDPFASLRSYKARPLNGIWATAPYLHNGSVPTLYHLLLPAEQRPARFAVGQMEFDPVKVGFKHDSDDPQAPYVFDTSEVGNSNAGHEYGTDLTEAQRQSLVEYLKTL